MATMPKTTLRAWLNRIREDLQDVERIIAQPGPLNVGQLADIETAMEDASGAAAQVITDLRGEQ